MLINLIDNVPLENGVFAYGVTAGGGKSAYCVYCTEWELLLLPINTQALIDAQKGGAENGVPTERKTQNR